MCKILRRANAQTPMQATKRLRHNAENKRQGFAKIAFYFRTLRDLFRFLLVDLRRLREEMHINFLL
ncbi:MAG: hypothetical protein ABS68_07820 [Niastella sp. SCN 39-18]|nr:MAG: hypothetical protein ABS68_07820 [Niastella sp. SCN 39-18]OJW11627.1 MAG: hypothetical protein BGO53_11890 [Sphingobacteriales bacterium 39-19]